MGLVFTTSHNLVPQIMLIMKFNVQTNAILIHEIAKNLPTVGGGQPPPTPPPPPPAWSLRSLALAPPLL